jgi:hypothetical protein
MYNPSPVSVSQRLSAVNYNLKLNLIDPSLTLYKSGLYTSKNIGIITNKSPFFLTNNSWLNKLAN